ncbi:MAG: IS66 family transposase [Armatimonadetes bacterium]|nr:IS66 family transposase [Armatimonadota bacterium]
MKKNRAVKRRRIDIDLRELDGVMDAAVEEPITETDANKVKTALHVLVERLTPEPRSTEKTAQVVESPPPVSSEESKSPSPRHGRNGAAAFTSVQKVEVANSDLSAGCTCPECQKGKVYPQKERKTLLRFAAQPPIQATVYELERLRCNLCGEVFTAQEPEGAGPEKYDETVPSMVAQLKYGSGMPFNRIEALQKKLGVPLPASTQWELVNDAAELVKPVHDALIEQAAQGQVLHNDDTGMRVLNIERGANDKRTGVFTTGVVSAGGGHEVALYFTGAQHAGENLRDVLEHRSKDAKAPMLMCDALSRNVPKPEAPDSLSVILGNCLAHGRRHFVDVADNFPDECRYVLETLGEVYGNDEQARERGMSPQERLALHKERSSPLMKKLKAWMTAQLEEKRTEPNSGLGQAMKYMLKHWDPLTLFLRKAGAPLDNNICERALKKAVLHRKNALFYRTINGAQVGDLFMSLIHTCELNDVNPFNYMTELQRHAEELRKDPTA